MQLNRHLVIAALCLVTGTQVWAQALEPDRPAPRPPTRVPDFLTLPAQPRPPARPVAAAQPPLSADVVAWDAESKDYNAKTGEVTANFTFNLTNISPSEVVIESVRTSCGCTVAKLPEQPWHLASGTNGAIQVAVDLRNKFGTIAKTVTVNTSAGVKPLTVKVNIPAPAPAQPQVAGAVNRSTNMRTAMADRQAVFKGDCAKCHVEPTVAKMGKELYQAGCAICHDAEHRASMVPDLHAPKQPTTPEYWTKWVAEGKVGSLMPAFAQEHGGPLNKEQITSLVNYLSTDFPHTNAAPVATPAPARAGS